MLQQLPNRIPTPPWLQLINWIGDPIGFQEKYRQQYGDIFTMQSYQLSSHASLNHP